MELFGGNEWHPINKIRLGEVHTVHKDNGKAVENIFWYEPNFVEEKKFRPRNVELFKKNVKWVESQIEKSPYKDKLTNSLVRYVRALDEKDQNVALIKLWGALEELTLPDSSNYDALTRRISFLFKERDYHKQILENLREYRNRSIHAGDQSERIKTGCYQLQFYFRELILFHLYENKNFSTLCEVNEFLDMSCDRKTLEKRKKLIDKAIEFTE